MRITIKRPDRVIWIFIFLSFTVMFLQVRGFSDTDVPILIQIIGFVIFIPTITVKITIKIRKIYNLFFPQNKISYDSCKHSLQGYAICLIIYGHIMQTEFFNILYLECLSKEICQLVQ